MWGQSLRKCCHNRSILAVVMVNTLNTFASDSGYKWSVKVSSWASTTMCHYRASLITMTMLQLVSHKLFLSDRGTKSALFLDGYCILWYVIRCRGQHTVTAVCTLSIVFFLINKPTNRFNYKPLCSRSCMIVLHGSGSILDHVPSCIQRLYWCRWQHYRLFPAHTVTHFPPRTFTFAVPADMQANGFVSLWKLTWFN